LDQRINSATIDSKKVRALAKFFEAYPDVTLVTTNYDTLLSDHVLVGRFSRVFVEGSTVPKANIGTNIFHLHGCISDPQSIVLTINDYFKFQHKDTYLSRKFFTLLQETTVIIMGYSLGDFNLNRIFNEAQVSRGVSLRKSDIYLIARESVDQTITDFYSYIYGVRVVAPYEIDEVFSNITESEPIAQKLIDQSGILDRVLQGSARWTDEYLKLADSFQRILLQASSIGVAVDDANFKKMLLDVLERKRQFSREDNAWSQYEHLADWLVEIGCLIDVKQAGISEEYLRLVYYSFRYMRKELIVSYSWAAFQVWRARFRDLKIENQNLIREYAAKNFPVGGDIAEVINTV
jgi:SIR2-like domain